MPRDMEIGMPRDILSHFVPVCVSQGFFFFWGGGTWRWGHLETFCLAVTARDIMSCCSPVSMYPREVL